MFDEVLSYFPEESAPLYVVSDPDCLLADEDLLAALYGRGFALVDEPDPVRLRYRVLQIGERSSRRPLIIVTDEATERVPYDLWQQAERVRLSLARFFPNFAYPVLKLLSARQRARLSIVPAPSRLLGEQSSIDYILKHAFGVDLQRWQNPGELVSWLDAYHAGAADPLPAPFVERLQEKLKAMPQYRAWPTMELLTRAESFGEFVSGQWQAYLVRQTGSRFGETAPQYVLSFEDDQGLQDALPRLLRSGSLQRVGVPDPDELPDWARVGVVAPDEDFKERRISELLDQLALHSVDIEQAPWSKWQLVARTWAELSNLVNSEEGVDKGAYSHWQVRLDKLFLAWLQERYASLGVKSLPIPHHLFHVPHFLDWQRHQGNASPVALIVLDGMSLSDWNLIRRQLENRRPNWGYDETLLLAQIPSITPVSRQALISGDRPAEFPERLSDNSQEAKRWQAFWARQDVPAGGCLYERLYLETGEVPAGLGSSRLQAVCLISNSLDDLTHGAKLGAADMLASLKIWLAERLPRLENVLAELLGRGFLVYLASDHGHVEAAGMGNPREGQIAETRGLRARIYRDRALAEQLHADFPDTILWESQGVLPSDAYVLIPRGRKAFASERETVVTHGGLTLDELVVPLVRISATG